MNTLNGENSFLLNDDQNNLFQPQYSSACIYKFILNAIEFALRFKAKFMLVVVNSWKTLYVLCKAFTKCAIVDKNLTL